MDHILQEFSKEVIWEHEMPMYQPADAIRVIQKCKECGIKIYVLDAFNILGEYIQPSLEYSIDFTVGLGPDEEITDGHWDDAVAFLETNKDRGFLYEILYEWRD
jgi:hypothetical protein